MIDTKLIKKSFQGILVKFVGILSSLIISWILTNNLSIGDVGIYFYFNQLIIISSVLGVFGLNGIVFQRFPYFLKRKKFLLNIYLSTIFLILIVSVVIMLILLFFYLNIEENILNNKMKIACIISIIPGIFNSFLSFFLIARNKIWQSSFVSQGIVNFLCLIFCLFLYLNSQLNILNILYSLTFCRFLLLIFLIYESFFKIQFRFSLFKINKRILLKVLIISLPLFFSTSINVLKNNFEVIIIPFMFDEDDYGIYAIASKMSLLISIFLVIVNSTIIKKISLLYKENKMKKIQDIILKINKLLSLLAILSFLVFLIFGNELLYFWNINDERSYFILLILCFGQIINLSTAFTHQLLVISKNQNNLFILNLISIIILIITSYYFSIKYGLIGIAFSVAFSEILTNLMRVIVTYKKTKILVIPFKLNIN